MFQNMYITWRFGITEIELKHTILQENFIVTISNFGLACMKSSGSFVEKWYVAKFRLIILTGPVELLSNYWWITGKLLTNHCIFCLKCQNLWLLQRNYNVISQYYYLIFTVFFSKKVYDSADVRQGFLSHGPCHQFRSPRLLSPLLTVVEQRHEVSFCSHM